MKVSFNEAKKDVMKILKENAHSPYSLGTALIIADQLSRTEWVSKDYYLLRLERLKKTV